MKKDQRGFMSDGDFAVFVIIIALGGAAVAYAIPWLWSLLKPLIHSMTS